MSLLLALAVPAALLQDTVRPPDLGQDVFRLADSIAAAEFAKDSLGSVSVGIVSGARLVWAKSYGFEDRARTRPATPATVYRVGSVTKQLTALMLLQLAEAGRVQLSDPAERFFPQVRAVRGRPRNSAPITLVQLATMPRGSRATRTTSAARSGGSPRRGSNRSARRSPGRPTRRSRAPATGTRTSGMPSWGRPSPARPASAT